MKKIIGFILLLWSINNVNAQYLGGSNHGAADGLLSQSNCSDITPNFIYFGGNNDGAADGLLSQSNCGDITPNFIYFGGNNDGAADGLLSQSNCGDITPNFIYFGGNNDGAADGLLSQSNCGDITPNFIYFGGLNDGAADGLLSQSNCGDITPNFIYFGGSNDGAADGLLSQSNCGDITPKFIYFGGSNDGAGFGLLSQSILTTATASISTPQLSICPNTSVTFTSNVTNGGLSPTYSWRVNGIVVGNNSSTLVTDTFTAAKAISLVLFPSIDVCPINSTIASNSLNVSILTGLSNVTASTSSPQICSGSSVQLNASASTTARFDTAFIHGFESNQTNWTLINGSTGGNTTTRNGTNFKKSFSDRG
jgi:hypothetical protein